MKGVKEEIGYVVIDDISRIGRSIKDINEFQRKVAELGLIIKLKPTLNRTKTPQTTLKAFEETLMSCMGQAYFEQRSTAIKRGIARKKETQEK